MEYIKTKKDREFFKYYTKYILKVKNDQIQIEQDFNMFSSSIRFLLVMLTGNQDENSVKYIIQSIDLAQLINIAKVTTPPI